jgi:hypothetical protein
MIQFPMGMWHDTFTLDYSPSALDSNGWTQSESSEYYSLTSHDDSVSSIVAHRAEVGSSREASVMQQTERF